MLDITNKNPKTVGQNINPNPVYFCSSEDPSKNVAVTSEKMPRRGWFFATFIFYLLDTIFEIFGVRAFAERKIQAFSQQDVTRTDWIHIVKHKIENRE